MPTPDSAVPENNKDNLDRRLDHAIEETFPTSDPVSVAVTKGEAIDYDEAGQPMQGRSSQGARGGAEDLLGQARDTAERVRASASEAAREAYDRGQRYMRAARERYPEAERYYRESTQVVRQQASEHPLMTLLVGVGLGYVLALMLRGRSRSEDVPDHARTRRGFTPYRS